MSIEKFFEQIKKEEQARARITAEHRLRHYLACALCNTCGEPLGENDSDIMVDDEDRTIHVHCLRKEQQ